MINIRTHNKPPPILAKRFQQTVLFTILLLSLSVFATSFYSQSGNIQLFLILDVLIMFALFPLIKREKLIIAKQIFLWSNLFILSYVFWSKGGALSSSVILIYPVFLMISALLVGPRTFFLTYVFVITLIVVSSFRAVNSIVNQQFSTLTYWDLSITIILLSAAGLTAWLFNSDMRGALKKLKTEVANVKNSHDHIERLIYFDPLTGLSSRLRGEEKYNLVKAEFDEKSEHISFLFIDIDNFKSINDYYNRAAGDEVLNEVANRLVNLVKENDVACRLNGDEFLLILTRPKNYSIEQFSKRILREISLPAEVFGNCIEITASLGVATYDDTQDESFESLLKKTDLAMYRAKQSGKNNMSFYDQELSSESSRKIRIIKGLSLALKNNDLELFLQPKVDIFSGKVESAEALIRWERNNPENFSPAEFIPLIESTELIRNLGDWVIARACVLCKELHINGYQDLSISVNISAAQFLMGSLENTIIRELQKTKLDPKYLELELTEHILFKDDQDMMDELSRIKDLGVTLSIDDFGTGYSNLGYLTKFNMDTLKIDKSFITDINQSSENFAIVDAIIKMAKALGLSIVAEGVETQQEWDVLKQLGCDKGQGFIWSKPLHSKDFLIHLSQVA